MSRMNVRKPVSVNPVLLHEREKRISLSGEWRFRLDPEDVGVEQEWFRSANAFYEFIQVPGCWQGQGFGTSETEKTKELEFPARIFQATYEGTGWYEKEFTVPEQWQGKRIWLNFGGTYPTAHIWVNGKPLGEHHEPFVPFALEISEYIVWGQDNNVVVRISEEDRTLGMTFDFAGKWSGLYRDVELTATGDTWLEQLRILPDADTGKVQVIAQIEGSAEQDQSVLQVSITSPSGEKILGQASVDQGQAVLTLTTESFQKWSPDSPVLYTAEAELLVNGECADARSDRFGFVKLSTKGKHFLINEEPYYMRGTGYFPEDVETGCPDTNRDRWRKRLQALRDFGYNYVRCNSWVPAPEYFDVADEVGLLVQSEMGTMGPICGYSNEHTYNMWPMPTPDYRELYRRQWNDVVLRDVNHPSANIYCMSNELFQTDIWVHFKKVAWRCYRETKAIKPTSLVIWTDGGYSEDMPGDFVNENSVIDERIEKPVIQHEYAWWSSFPDVRTFHKFKGCAKRHFIMDVTMETATRKGLLHILQQSAENSQILQYIEAKGKMELKRRDFPTLAGICHFNAMDVEMSPQGVIDIFYEHKYVTAEQWLMTNGDTVLLSSLKFNDRVLTAGEEWRCSFYVSDFSHPAFQSPRFTWSLVNGEEILYSGELEFEHQAYRTHPIGEIALTVPQVDQALAVQLKVKLCEGARQAENVWDLWIFPQVKELPRKVSVSENGEIAEGAEVIIADRLTEELVAFTEAGGAVILTGSEGFVRPFKRIMGVNEGRYYFTRPANWPAFEELQHGTIIQKHPMLGDFPCESHADLQFYRMIAESPALDLEPLGLNDADPVIRMIHTFCVGRGLGYLTERQLGKGRIVMMSLKIHKEMPESVYLLQQICQYLLEKQWQQCPEIRPEAITKLLESSNIDKDFA